VEATQFLGGDIKGCVWAELAAQRVYVLGDLVVGGVGDELGESGYGARLVSLNRNAVDAKTFGECGLRFWADRP
jgi:hypothetical protein